MLQARSWLPRTEGAVRLAFAHAAGRTRLAGLYQSGAARVRFPKPAAGDDPEAVLLNTAGGLTGGDRMEAEIALGEGCAATVTTAAAEKIYRSLGEPVTVEARLDLRESARCHWLPQPTILFDGASLQRRTTVEMAAGARLLAAETLIFGRAAMGEDVHRGFCSDSWRVRREGRLVFADTVRIGGAVADALDRPGTLDGARATGMVLYVASDAEARLADVRALLENATSTAGASTWNGILLVRAAAGDGRTLQSDLQRVLVCLAGAPLPRVWQC